MTPEEIIKAAQEGKQFRYVHAPNDCCNYTGITLEAILKGAIELRSEPKTKAQEFEELLEETEGDSGWHEDTLKVFRYLHDRLAELEKGSDE